MKAILDWLGSHIILKNLLLIGCAVVILAVTVNVLLGIFTHHNRHHVVPNFAGMTLEEARHAGRGGSLFFEVTDSIYRADVAPGAILTQRPEAGSEVKSGRRILVMINAHQPMMVRVPYATGVSLRQATNDLRTSGFVVKELIFRSDLATDYVLETRLGAQRVAPGSNVEAAQGSGITLVVGTAGEAVKVPRVVGLTPDEARWALWGGGLNVGAVNAASEGAPNGVAAKVVRQSPGAGAEVSRGSKVALTLGDE